MGQYIYGINPVLLAIQANRVKKVFVSDTFNNKNVLNTIKKAGITIEFLRKERINSLSSNRKNQGILAEVFDYKTLSIEDFINKNKNKETSVLIILDNLEDPHNLGAILRICDAFNIDGVMFKKNNQVGITPSVIKVSTGAINFVDCVEVTNLTQAITKLKEEGYWIYASDMDGSENYFDVDYANKICLVIGSEGFGISHLVKENCDFVIKIPMSGHVNSLNASNACSIIVSDIYRKKLLKSS